MWFGNFVDFSQRGEVGSIFKIGQSKIVDGIWRGWRRQNLVNLLVVGRKAICCVHCHFAGARIKCAEEHALAALWHGDGGCGIKFEVGKGQRHQPRKAREFSVVCKLVQAVAATFAGAGRHVQQLVAAKWNGAKVCAADGVDGAHILPCK